MVVVTHQGPRSNGMPELHKLSPYLSVLHKRGHKVALLTDGRMSGASGKILAAIHVTPEAVSGGYIGRIVDGDLVTIDAAQGVLCVAADLDSRGTPPPGDADDVVGVGRELFGVFRDRVGSAEEGGSVFAA